MDFLKDNRFCKLTGVKYPIIQGGMAWIADAYLASAVSNGGGLGLIAAMSSTGEELRQQIRLCKTLTDKPFGVNLMLQSKSIEDAARVVVEEGVRVVTTGAGSPSKFMEAFLNAGIKVFPVVPSVAYAILMERAGASGIVCEGCEAGGHIGEATTMALIPQVVDAVSVPVIAAGGIGDGRAIAAAFMLGAQGVQVGTRFLSADECRIHQNYKDLVFKAGDNDTIVTGKRFGHPVRSLKSKFSRGFAALENDPNVTADQVLKLGSGALMRAVRDGDIENGSFMAGQIAGLVKKGQPAAEIIAEMFDGFYKALDRFCH